MTSDAQPSSRDAAVATGEHHHRGPRRAATDRAALDRRQRTAFAVQRLEVSGGTLADRAFFVAGGVVSVWLIVAIVVYGARFGWGWYVVVATAAWLVLAYLTLPRVHRVLSAVYVPNYFIGRARTSDGLLGDPVNVAVVGEESQLHRAMLDAGWTRADDITLQSTWRIVASTLSRRSYDEAPVSPLFLFGRRQDFAYQQEVDGNPGKRHHVRFWRCPDGWPLPGGRRVDWLAAGTYDRAVGFSLFTLQVTHKIDEDTDIERDHIVATVLDGSPDARVTVIEDFATGYHSRNGGGDSIITDGDLPILDVRSLPIDPALESGARPVAPILDATGLYAAMRARHAAVSGASGADGGAGADGGSATGAAAGADTAAGAVTSDGPDTSDDAAAATGDRQPSRTARAIDALAADVDDILEETPEELAYDLWSRRPLALVVGCALAVIAAGIGVARFLWQVEHFDALLELRVDASLMQQFGLSSADELVRVAWTALLVAGAVAVALQFVLAYFAAIGARTARGLLMTVLLIASVALLLQLGAPTTGRIGLLIDLANLLAQVAALLALSSTASREFVAARRIRLRLRRRARRADSTAQR